MGIGLVKAKINTVGVDISGEQVHMIAGQTYLIPGSRMDKYAEHTDAFSIIARDVSLSAFDSTGTKQYRPSDGALIDPAAAFQLVGSGTPAGIDWLTDTINSFDIYKQGFVQRPTIFFDPQATDANGRGTFAKPYSTAAQLEAAINRLSKNNTAHIGGQVIGFKRGSKLHGGPLLRMAGAAGDPVFVVPYGDAEELPIITGATVYALTGDASTGWAVSSDSRVYKINSAVEWDVFDTTQTPVYSQRFTKVAPGANEAAAIAAVIDGGPGHRTWLAGVTYIYPFNGTPDWTALEVNNKANSGGVYNGLSIGLANIAASGFVTVAGIHVRSVGNMGIYCAPVGSVGSVTSIGAMSVIGCEIGNTGSDTTASLQQGMAAGGIYGISNALRVQDPVWAGNYAYDLMNNGGEFGRTDGLIFEYNKVDYSQGPCCAELYLNNSGSVVRYNIGKGRRNKLLLNPRHGNKGMWLSGYADDAATKTNIQNQNNTIHHNVITEVGTGQGIDICGLNTLVYNNYVDSDLTGGGNIVNINDDAANHSTTTLSNNVFNSTTGGGGGRCVLGNAGTVTTLSNNFYRRSDGSINVYINATNNTTLAALISAGANGDANAKGAATTFTSGRPPSGNVLLSAGVTVAGYTEVDKDGVYAAIPAIGPYYVGA